MRGRIFGDKKTLAVYKKDGNLFSSGMVNGCCFGLRREFIESQRLLDDHIFLYYEENALSSTIIDTGKKGQGCLRIWEYTFDMSIQKRNIRLAPKKIPVAIGDPNQLNSNEIEMLAEILGVRVEDITGISALKRGMTNQSFLFSCQGAKYIIRIPGEGTERLISRKEEATVYQAIRGKGICEEVLYIDPDRGYKISKYIEGARVCNPLDIADTAACMGKLRMFHCLGLQVDHLFDIFAHIDFYEKLREGRNSIYSDYWQTKTNIFRLKPFLDSQMGKKVLTHIDAVPDNFLFYKNDQGEEEICLIDWEYAAMQDPHVDIAMFCIYARYNRTQVDQLVSQYFTEGCPVQTQAKIYCYIAACGLLWSNWCEYKRSLGVEFGSYALQQYRYAQDYYLIAVETLKKTGESRLCIQ